MGKTSSRVARLAASLTVMGLSFGCGGTGGERPAGEPVVSGGSSSSGTVPARASSTSSSISPSSSSSSSSSSVASATTASGSDGGLGSDAYFGMNDAPYNAVCLLDSVAFDVSYFAPDLDTVTTDFAAAWDAEVGNPVPDPHTPIAAIGLTGLAAGPQAMSIGAVTLDPSSGNFAFSSQPSLVLSNTPVTWSSAQPQHIVMNHSTTPFALLVGSPGQVRQITVIEASGEFDVDTTCQKLTGDITLTIPSSAGPVAFGASTIQGLLGAPANMSFQAAGQPDSWLIRISTPRGPAAPIPNFGN